MIADQAESAKGSVDRRWVAVVVGILLFAGVTVAWAAMPFEDHVTLVLPEGNEELVGNPDELPDAARFECSGVLGAEKEPEPDQAAVDALELQELARSPCDEIRTQRRPLVVVDLALAIGGLGGLVWIARRRRTRPTTPTAR